MKHRPILLATMISVALICNPGRVEAQPDTKTEGPDKSLVDRTSPDKYARTIVAPVLDYPIENGHNVIWCASFQLAWNELRRCHGPRGHRPS